MVLEKVKRLLELYEQGSIPTLVQHEVNPNLPKGCRENYLYFTSPVCINFQRNSPAMWASAIKTWDDPKTRYLFFPEKLQNVPIDQTRTDLLKHKLALQPNKHTLIWTTIARAFYEYYESDPRKLLAEANNDVGILIALLQTTYKKRFPYLCGPKLSNYWPYILSSYTDITFANPQEISIIPDTHVIQSSVVLKLVHEGAHATEVERAWKTLLMGTGINPSTLHPVLWNWSRNKFQPMV